LAESKKKGGKKERTGGERRKREEESLGKGQKGGKKCDQFGKNPPTRPAAKNNCTGIEGKGRVAK